MIYGNMKEHKYEVEGIKPQIMTEVSTLLHICYEKGIFNKDDLNKITEFACMSNEDMHDEVMNKLDSTIDALRILTDMMLKDKENKE